MKLSPVHSWTARKSGLDIDLAPESLSRYQMARVREVLAYAKHNSRYYRSTLAAVEPDLLSTPADLSRVPFTSAEEVELYGCDMVCVPQSQVARIITLNTSGTSGRVKRLYFSDSDLELCIDFFAQGMMTMVHPGDRVAVFLPGDGEGGVVDLLKRGLERINVKLYQYDFSKTTSLPSADCVVGLPAQVYQLAKIYPGQGPKSVLLCADYVPRSVINTIEHLWETEVFTHYGSTESGLGGGVECQAHQGHHLRDADLLFEIVDPETGHNVPPGLDGEIVFTTLTRKAMPLFRYRTGDIGRITASPCPCGSQLKRLGSVKGRYANLIRLKNGSLISIHHLDQLMFGLPEIIDYRVTYIAAKECLKFLVRTITTTDVTNLGTLITKCLDLPLAIKVSITDSILPPTGKRLISNGDPGECATCKWESVCQPPFPGVG